MTDRRENKYLDDYGIHYSRIIASWYEAGGKRIESFWTNPFTGEENEFIRWLKQTRALSDEDIKNIFLQATNGKLEWVNNAKKFLKAESKD